MSPKNIRVFELRLGKRSLIYFVLGVSSLVFLCFYLGILVGRDMDAYPEKYARGFLPAFLEGVGWVSKKAENPSIAKESPSQEIRATEGGEQDLTFFDNLSKRKKDGMEDARGIKQQQAVIEKEKASPVTAAEAIKKEPAEASKKETVDTHSRKEHTAAIQRAGIQTYQIQVVAYRERTKAEAVARKLTKLGYSTHIEEKKVAAKGGKWYRVILGGFETEKDAHAAVHVISREINGVKCIVRPVEKKSQ